MSKRKKNLGSITIDPMTIWNMRKPKYDGYTCGHGAHGKTKYSRKEKYKTDWRKHEPVD